MYCCYPLTHLFPMLTHLIPENIRKSGTCLSVLLLSINPFVPNANPYGFLMFSGIKWVSIGNKWVNRWLQYRQTCTHLLVCVQGVEKGCIGNKWVNKSSHRRALYQKDIFENLTNFTGKYLCWSLFLIKLQAFIKKELQHRYFLAKFTKFLRTPILKNICKQLLLY